MITPNNRQIDMIIPVDMIEACGKIFGGEYDVSYNNSKPIILDIGANVGAFSVWAKYRWPDSMIYAYEPVPQCLEYLTKNTENLDNIQCYPVAVGSSSGTRKIYYGYNNRGMSSFNKSKYTRDQAIDVQVIGAKTLPEAHIVKCDTEGAEIEILENLSFDPHIIVVEYHSMENKKLLENMFFNKYTILQSTFLNTNSGILKFARTDIISEESTNS